MRVRSDDAPDRTSACDGSSTNGLRSAEIARPDLEQLARRRLAATWRPGASRARRAVIIVASTISSIGVMPAIGSVENWPSEYDTAPISLPST